MVLIYVYKGLLAIKDIRAVVAFITNQALGVVHVRVDHLHFQHVAHLTGIGPSGASALRTGCCVRPAVSAQHEQFGHRRQRAL